MSTKLRYRLLAGGFAAAERAVPRRLLPPLGPDRLVAAAGVVPSAAAREGLDQLLQALCRDTELTLFGRLSLRWDMVRLLRDADLVARAHDRAPNLAAAAVAAPIFILGLPRSGTTFLHTLLAEDAANLVPRNWQTIYPAPRPAGFIAATDANARRVDAQLKLFAGLAPGFAQLHPVHADSPQECSEITAHVFESLRFDTTFRVPDYLAWLDSHGDLEGFRYHKKFLQFLQAGTPRRWVLKCPDHTFSLSAILAVYPDARFIIVHRDPLQVLGSVARLTEILRRPFVKNIDPHEVGAQVAQRWIDGAARLVAFGQETDVAPARKIHIRHDALIADPLGTMREIYRRFGMTLSDAAIAAVARLLQARPRGGYTRHKPYSLQPYAMSPEWLTENFAGYVSKYCQG